MPAHSELISEEMTELISNRPHWIVRKGNMIFLFLLLVLAGISWFVEYPDTIKASLHIVAVDAPKLLTARKDGKLEKLLVSNEDQVHAGQDLAFLQSTASHRQVIRLYQWILLIESHSMKYGPDLLLKDHLSPYDSLGEIQPAYQEFENSLIETAQLIENGFYQQKERALRQDIDLIREAENTTRRQKELTDADLALQNVEYKAKESLVKEKIIAPLEFNQDKAKLLVKQQAVEQFNSQLINSRITTNNKLKEMLELQKAMADQQQKFHTALLVLKSKVQDWLQQYVVTAPVDGKVNFVSFLQENQYVRNSQDLFYIIPVSNKFYGEVKTGQAGIGRVKLHQKTIVRINSFPSDEFGYLTGVVSYIQPMVNSDSTILIKVDFSNGLKTNYGKELLFKNNMNAVAEIITENRRLAERLVFQLRGLMK